VAAASSLTRRNPQVRHTRRIIPWPKSGFRNWFGQEPGITVIPCSWHIRTASGERLVMPEARPGLVPISPEEERYPWR
jgi:hypothetical protein